MQIEIPDEVAAALDAEAEARGQDVSAMAAEMLTEAIKMRRIRGIVFEDGATGRRAVIAGTGINVFEIIEYYEYVGRDRERLRHGFDWLDPDQFDAAIAYYEAFPEDITPRIKTEDEAEAELRALWARHPQTSPHWPGRQQGVRSKAPVDTT